LSEKKGMMNYILKSIRNFFLRLKTYRFMKHMVLEFLKTKHITVKKAAVATSSACPSSPFVFVELIGLIMKGKVIKSYSL